MACFMLLSHITTGLNIILCLGRAENHYFKEVEVSMNVITSEQNGPSCIQQMVFGWKLIFLMS